MTCLNITQSLGFSFLTTDRRIHESNHFRGPGSTLVCYTVHFQLDHMTATVACHQILPVLTWSLYCLPPRDGLNAENQFDFMLYIWSCSSSYVVLHSKGVDSSSRKEKKKSLKKKTCLLLPSIGAARANRHVKFAKIKGWLKKTNCWVGY